MNQGFNTQIRYFLHGEIKSDEPLADYTSFGIGGPADYLAIVRNLPQLQDLIALANDYQQPIFILGQGTNLLVGDKGIRGLVLKLAGEFGEARVQGNQLMVGGGCLLSSLLGLSIRYGLAGLELTTGIPGSLGGAIFVNAGSSHEGIGSLVKELHLVYPDGSTGNRSIAKLHFSYRQSSLNQGEIITGAVLELRPGEDKKIIASRVKDRYRHRASQHPLREKSAGCIFKNPPGDSAGRLIDQAGLKGLSVGDAQISTRHANFIINRNQASCADVLRLMDLIQRKVYQFFGITLEPEIKVVGEV